MTRAAQIPLDLPHRPALGREDFLVTPANEMAVAWIDRWPAWPQPALALHGPAGAGKSHLACVWRAASGAVALGAADLLDGQPPELLGTATACVVDEAEAALARGGPASERRLLHLLNMLRERGGHLLLTGRQAPARWPVRLPDLRSRLAAMPAVALEEPDDALIEAVLIKLFADRQLRVGPEVVGFLLPRIERSFSAARDTVEAVDRAALAARRQITVPLVSRVLRERQAADAGAEPQGEIDHGPGNRR